MTREPLSQDGLLRGIPQEVLARIEEQFSEADDDIFKKIYDSKEMEEFLVSLNAQPSSEGIKQNSLLEDIKQRLQVKPRRVPKSS